MVKNMPLNAGDMGLIPGPGRSHMPQRNLSPRAATTEAWAPRAVLRNKRRLYTETRE